MTWPALTAVILTAWALTTAGLALLLHSWPVVLLSAGVALAALAWIDLRAKVAAELAGKDEAPK